MAARAQVLVLLLVGCGAPTKDTLFTRVGPEESGITFANTLEFAPDFNIFEYLYFYDGGGVALGDVNRDGLPDVFLTGNQVSNRLYLNRGDWTFEDVTERAGVASAGWSTGATFADVNGDGWLDLYVCQVHYKTLTGRNHLYINRGDGTFGEAAAEYGLGFEGLSTQAAFFDYDRDGDLDLYLLNHSVHTTDSFVPSWRRSIDAPRVGDRLYRNEGGTHFTNVTSGAGIYSSALGYGLGLAISDLNGDGWLDIYVGNDFHENDYLYLNQRDGTFAEVLQRTMGHTSQSTMGVDIGDYNNDLWPDIVALDMMPEDRATAVASGGPDEEHIARVKRNFGYAPQVARNTLQVHRGVDANGLPYFSEIGAYLGIHATDWSWTPLLADFDGDGWKDLFVTNGIPRRPNDLDYIEHVAQPTVQAILAGSNERALKNVAEHMPEALARNYVFRNLGGRGFSEAASEWGLDAVGASNGAAYGDLDGDGDLDLVVNNIHGTAYLYRNETQAPHSITIQLEGTGLNTTGIGAHVTLYAGDLVQAQEQIPTRGFQSSVPHALVFGLGGASLVDSVVVSWPDGRRQRLAAVTPDQRVVLRQIDAQEGAIPDVPTAEAWFTGVGAPAWRHEENEYEDFAVEPLIPHRLSTQGPALAVGDVDGDGVDDLFVGGALGQEAQLFLGGQVPSEPQAWVTDAEKEDVDAVFFDADQDGDLDLYVVRGGGEQDSLLWRDGLFFNDGSGSFAERAGSLPTFLANGCCAQAGDINGDGTPDLVVASRSVPGAYGVAPRSYVLIGDGNGNFVDETAQRAPMLLSAGMVTDIALADVTGSRALDLVLVGEWMPVTILENRAGTFVDVTEALGLAGTGGWWQSVMPVDMDSDGDWDLVAGNVGLNNVLSPPLELYVDDFDRDGRTDPLVVLGGKDRLWARRDALLGQMPSLAEALPTYADYAQARANSLVTLTAPAATAQTFASVLLENRGHFVAHPLPEEAQWSPIMDLISRDLDHNGTPDIVAVGNFLGTGSVQGPYTSSYGVVIAIDGAGTLTSRNHTGLIARGDARKVAFMHTSAWGTALVVAHSGRPLQVFRVNDP